MIKRSKFHDSSVTIEVEALKLLVVHTNGLKAAKYNAQAEDNAEGHLEA